MSCNCNFLEVVSSRIFETHFVMNGVEDVVQSSALKLMHVTLNLQPGYLQISHRYFLSHLSLILR